MQIDWNKWLVYNNDGLLVLMEAWNLSEDRFEISVRTYLNSNNYSKEYINDNLKKMLPKKTKFIAMFKKKLFFGPFNGDIVLPGETINQVNKEHEVLAKKFEEITSMIESFLSEGKIVKNFNDMNGIVIDDCNVGELNSLLNGFEILEQKHRKNPTKKGR